MRRGCIVAVLACLTLGPSPPAGAGFLDNLWGSSEETPEKKPAKTQTAPPEPASPSPAKTPEKKPKKAVPQKAKAPEKPAAPAAAKAAAAKQPAKTPAKTPAKPSWVVNCRQLANDKQACSMAQNIILARTKQRLLRVAVRPAAKAGAYGLVLSLPHGLFLPAGVELKIDESEPVKLVIQTSDAKGSYAGGPLGDPFLAALRKGNTLKVSFAAANKKVISVPVTLAGFTSAFDRLAKAR